MRKIIFNKKFLAIVGICLSVAGGFAIKQKITTKASDHSFEVNGMNVSIQQCEGKSEEIMEEETKYPDDYAPEVLETFENKHPENDYFVKFNAPEFTSLCPITGQPDFATIYISYVPGERMVESKSLKLYLYSFRNHGDFHEDCMNIIMKDLIKLMDPKYIEVWGKFTPRGGISIDPYCNYGRPGTKWEDVAWNRLSNHDLYPEKVDNR